MQKIVFCIAGLFLAACSSTGPVQISKDTYMITKQSAGGLFVQPSSIRVEIIREASGFCSGSGKVFQLNSYRDTPAVPGRNLPSSEINFMCLSEGDAEIARIKLRKEANTIVEVREK